MATREAAINAANISRYIRFVPDGHVGTRRRGRPPETRAPAGERNQAEHTLEQGRSMERGQFGDFIADSWREERKEKKSFA
ncbi:hypothetical protein CEXT_802721 [Caerostris extrusa]|uniref:Uncharacterized protein n=1 Tax=Caerostris extrusa TaxID=172846 RepID=A0AAV4NSM3_CAEEX|nr:hypothetical protein CEXT_802721 [Caerostris extrusa]